MSSKDYSRDLRGSVAGADNQNPKNEGYEGGTESESKSALPSVTLEFYLLPIPKHLRHVPGQHFQLSLKNLCVYALVTTFLTGNLYYCQPLLIQMAQDFAVSYEGVARIPTFVQAGYAVGLFIICPLGDMMKRRQLVLALLVTTTSLTIGLSLTFNVRLFEALNFIMGAANVAPQILIPLVAEMSPPNRRAFTYTFLLTGILFGVLLARVIAGLIGEFVKWRIVYYAAIGIQGAVLFTLYFTLPDHPAKLPDLSYLSVFWTMAKLAFTEPLVVQMILINIGTSACFAYYWVTLTFLLGGPPYFYNTLEIGLFGLIGMAGVAAGPVSANVVDRITPWKAIFWSTLFLIMVQAVQFAAGGIHIAAVIISCFGIDFFQEIQNVGLAAAIFSVSTDAISRLNAIFMISFYCGQMIGTSVGTKLFVRFGWRASAAFGLALFILQLVILLLRGPNCGRYTWFGYEGGLKAKTLSSEDVMYPGHMSTTMDEESMKQ